MQERINAYVAHCGEKPKRIVYVRDGVGDSQFKRLLQEEWSCLRDAVKMALPDDKPYLVFVVAQKSHSLRVFDPSGHVSNLFTIMSIVRVCRRAM